MGRPRALLILTYDCSNAAMLQAGNGGTHSSVLSSALCWHKQPDLIGCAWRPECRAARDTAYPPPLPLRLRFHRPLNERMSTIVGKAIWEAVKEANAELELRLPVGSPVPWEHCCTVRIHDTTAPSLL